ncbi:MAG: polysaccharide deacetylase family protein [Planctomycetia bacterium]|nr:polysaccharide deacetylase family protein [Planctomycetia bacterium]
MTAPIDDSQGAISLSFDDALDEHLNFVVPVLNDHELAATFYVHLAAVGFTKRIDDWRAAAECGHELGNHTIFHPADRRKSWVREGNEIDRYTLDRMRQELETANRLLAAIDGCHSRTFAYPCSNSILGHRGFVKELLFKIGLERTRLPDLVDRWHLDLGSTEASYVAVVRELFPAARAGGLERSSDVPPVNEFDRYRIPSVAVEDWSVRDLIAFTERGLASRTWVNLQFHGVGGGHRLNCDLAVFREYVAWLRANCRDRVAPIRDVAARLWTDSLREIKRPEPVSTAT